MERLGLAMLPAVLIGVSFAVLSFRVVRRQYGPMLAAQPEVAKGPPRVVLLGLCGVVMAAAGAFLVPAGLRLGMSETSLVGGFVLVLGGFGLVMGCGLYYHRPGRPVRSVPVRRIRIEGGARYVRREIALTIAPWLALAAAALGSLSRCRIWIGTSPSPQARWPGW